MQEDKETKETEENAAEKVPVSGEETKPAAEEIPVDGEGAAPAAETEAEGPEEEPAQQSAETSDSAGEGAPEAAPEEDSQESGQNRAETDVEKKEAERAEAMRRRREEWMLENERERERLIAERLGRHGRMEESGRENAGPKAPSEKVPETEQSQAGADAEKREAERAEAMRKRREERMRMRREQMLEEEREYEREHERIAAERRELRRRMEEEERENDCREEASWRRTVISRHREAPHRDEPEDRDLTLEAMRAALGDERRELRRQRESFENLASWGAIWPHELGALHSVLDEREQELEWKAEKIRARISEEKTDPSGDEEFFDPSADEPAQMFERDWARLMRSADPDYEEGRRPPHGYERPYYERPYSVYEGEAQRREMALRHEIRSVERERAELYKRRLTVRHAGGRDMPSDRRSPAARQHAGIEAKYRQLAWELTQREWALRGDIARMRAERDGRPEPPPPHPGHGRPGGRCDGPGGPGRHERAGGPDGPDGPNRRH